MSRLFRKSVYRAYHHIRRDGLNEAIAALDDNQWLRSSELQQIQREKLGQLIGHVARHVPYYRQVFRSRNWRAEDLVEPSQFAQIPPLSKALIRENRESLISEDLKGNGIFQNSTSGSTGEALNFFTDQNSTKFRKAAEIRGRIWAGWHQGEGLISLWGSPIDQKMGTSLRGKLHGWITKHELLSSYDLSQEAMSLYVDRLLDFAPTLLVSYPGPLEVFAEYCMERSVRIPSLRGIITSAEMLWPHQRKAIEESFQVPVLNRYGCREFGIVAQECKAQNGLHVSNDRVYVEIVDENNNPCAPGKSGRLLITDLDNIGWPMLRYEVGDGAAWAEDSDCDCGRGLPRLLSVDGRTLDVVRTPAGERIGGTFWTLLFRSRPGIKQFQVVQQKTDGVRISFIREESFDRSCLNYFESKIAERCGRDFLVEFKEVESIELTQGGKRRIIVSNCR